MVGVLFALLLAAMMAVGSGANFNTTSANPGNIVTAGDLKHTNTGAKMTVTKLKPGETRSAGTVKIENTGDIDGVFTVAKNVVTDSNALAGKPAFADKLRVRIYDQTANQEVYNGVLSAMATPGAGTILPGAANAHTYEFSVTFPDAGGANGSDNAYKAASVEVDFNWEGVNTP